MAARPKVRLLLIVTGSSLRAEEADRPLAYYLKQQVQEQITLLATPEPVPVETMVVADFRFLNEQAWQRLPTISLGGPGVNALTHHWLEEVPLSLSVDGQYYIQMDPELSELRVSIWGMDNSTTQIAVSAFIQRYLRRFLERCQSEITDLIDLDEDT